MLIKTCLHCNKNKRLTSFHRNKSSEDGLNSICKICSNKRRNAYRRAAPYDSEKNRIITRTNKSRFSISRSRAKTRQIPWKLTLEEWVGLVIGQDCHYCNGEMSQTGVGLDRKDNDLGYVLENVTPCCAVCNRIKGQVLTYEEMLAVAKLLKDLRKPEPAPLRRFATQTIRF